MRSIRHTIVRMHFWPKSLWLCDSVIWVSNMLESPPITMSSISALTRVIGSNVNLKAALCQSCTSSCIRLLCSYHPTCTWAVHLKCISCLQSWSMCKHCPRFRTKLVQPHMVNKHSSQRHAPITACTNGMR